MPFWDKDYSDDAQNTEQVDDWDTSLPEEDTSDYYDDDLIDEDYPEEDPDSSRSHGRLFYTARYMGIVLACAVVLAIGLWILADDVLALTKPDSDVTITITDGETVDGIADALQAKGLIRYKWLFLLYCRMSDSEDVFVPGTYTLNQKYDYHALVNGMEAGSVERATITVTFPEGYTCSQIFAQLEANSVCTAAELQSTAANYPFDYDFLSDLPYGDANRLEGYLFPDTYEFYLNEEPEDVLNRFLSNFSSKFTSDMEDYIAVLNDRIRAAMQEDGTFSETEIEEAMLTERDVLTIASLIEKEAGGDEERSLISSVIFNRLTTHVHQLLQIDASVEYALGEHKTKLTAEDLLVDSPYNTYLYEGLPPGPIANPGLASIQAALEPADTDYFFYTLDTDGLHRFFQTYIQQQEFLDGNTDIGDTPMEIRQGTAGTSAEDAAEDGQADTVDETEQTGDIDNVGGESG